ncbi:transcriptional regulator, LuxR family [Luminiphilus syltensis NOR5-1B]|uniref:Transcriptional regulator, LuxR family n=1 Tax=Luminiphilus syltensis NOR5-1B TaxID=565045 RepID=B8KSK7_9GAMM|nr:helix-turn-helix transcriptional regulator [Luminiphilus syltensis]EED34234.1 transcriptional regulator, LuxR family [Luminiphilus syltensis NOR5-1B]
MVDLKTLNRWNVDLARVIETLGTDDFFPTLFEALRTQVKLSYPQAWLYHRDLPPQILSHDIPKRAVKLQIDRYLEGPYQEDPFYQTSIASPRSHIYRLGTLTSGKLPDSGYYRDYYQDTDTVDEVMFLSRLDGGSVTNLCVMRLPQQGPFTQDEYDLLYALAEPVAAVIKSHCLRDDFAVRNLLKPGIDHQIDIAFSSFGASYVSGREREVLELMLRGYGTATSAERLGISVETVRRHRKSIYGKLDVNSQADLFSLFINTMPFIGQAGGEDPLKIYMG